MAALKPSEIAAFVAKKDPAFRSIVKNAGNPPVRRSAPVDARFSALVRSITFQLLATNAANTIHGRVLDVCGGETTPETVRKAGEDALKSAGLNRTKAQAMIDLAQHCLDGTVDLRAHGRMSNSEVVQDVVKVRGIGPWTAQMYLMHTLGRHDVWPVGDYGVRAGWTLVHGLNEMISEKDLATEGPRFAGYESDVAWYCWQAVHFERLSK